MFESLIPWCTVPIIIQRRKTVTASGDAEYDDPVTVNGYPVGQIQDIIDKQGIKTVSSSFVYFPGTLVISEDDKLQTPDMSESCEIKRVNSFIDGNTGLIDIWVAYL